jgi:hypothetical protein
MKGLLTCRETTKLASRALDARLPLLDRIALRLHLAICKNCVRFNQQLKAMRHLIHSETGTPDDAPGLPPQARQRIANELQNRLDD